LRHETRTLRWFNRECWLWKEKEKYALAREVFEGDFLAFVGFEAKGGGFGTNFKH